MKKEFIDTTKFKNSKKKLQESEEKYKQLVSTTTDAIMFFDAHTREFVDVNKACEVLYGYSKKEFLKLRHDDITAEPDKSKDSIKEAIEGRLKRIPLRYHKKKDGTVFPVEIAASSFKLGSHRLLCGVIRDISERKKAEEALRESEEKWRSLAETAPDVILTVSRDGTILFLNRIVGEYTPEKAIGTSVYDYIPPRQRHVIRRSLGWVFQTGKPGSYEILGTGPRGPATSWYESRLGPIIRNGEVVAVTMVSTDITERKKTEERLRESEQRYKSVVNNIGIGISLISPKMEILTINTQVKKWYPHIDVSKRPICYKIFNFPPRKHMCSYCCTYKTLQDGQIHEAITDTPKGDKIINYRIISSPIKDRDGKIIARAQSDLSAYRLKSCMTVDERVQ